MSRGLLGSVPSREHVDRRRLNAKNGYNLHRPLPKIAEAAEGLAVRPCFVAGEGSSSTGMGCRSSTCCATDNDDGIVVNAHYQCDCTIIYTHACKLGCEGIVGSARRIGQVETPIGSRSKTRPRGPGSHM